MACNSLHALGEGGKSNPVDPLSCLCSIFASDGVLACEVVSRRPGDLWAFPSHHTGYFLWTLGVPMGPFLLPQLWQSRRWSMRYPKGAEFHNIFLQHRIAETTSAPTMRGQGICS